MQPTQTDTIVIYITVPNADEAQSLAQALVSEKLVACVNIVSGIQSVYSWQGEIQKDSELLLICKSRTERFEALQNRVQSLHSYDVPEIISIPITNGSEPYLNWVRENSTPQ
ncbi:MAG: divalent-cation tolerance protein CutA [Deltaproteobacteria bacterium]|nr:divalent-cation tolerance protein CutA [Deltaproteobacteria bacterium]MBT6488375.1 divalent-cation tolerance protein CutA [Deltaproteobacteria bacterium]